MCSKQKKNKNFELTDFSNRTPFMKGEITYKICRLRGILKMILDFKSPYVHSPQQS